MNALDADAASRELLRCCGSMAWARAMTSARPFASRDAMAAAADRIWASLDEDAWREAFGAHPRIGETRGRGDWAAHEQAGVADASRDVRQRLAAVNRDYEARFGYIFIVCATGKTADEMLAIIERRLHNEPDVEVRVAAEEQRKITRLRLEKLLAADPSPST